MTPNAQELPTVLIVEDDVQVARAVGRELRSRFSLHFATTAAEAKALLAVSPRFDAAVCDLHLGGPVDGVDVLSEARRVNPSAIRVVLSSDVPQDLGPLMVAGTVERYLAKPWVPGDVKKTLEDALGARAA